MAQATRSVSLPAAAAEVWRLVSTQGALLGSRFVGEKCAKGLGAERGCQNCQGQPVLEKVIAWDEGRGYRVTFVKHSLPVVWAEGGVRLESDLAGSTKVTFTVDYRPKYGALGRLLDAAFLHEQLERQLGSVIERLGRELAQGLDDASGALPAPAPQLI